MRYNTYYGNGRFGQTVTVTPKDILSQNPNLPFGARCRILPERGAKSHMTQLMQIQCENAPYKTIFQHTGYRMIDGKRVFLNGGYSVTENGLTNEFAVALENQLSGYGFHVERDNDRFSTLLTLLPSVAPHSLIYTGLALVFLSPLNAILRELGCEPSFILYFTGRTGSRKTTMAKLLLNFFGRFDNGGSPPANFRDTANAVEKKAALTDGVILLLDDRPPSTSQKYAAQLESLEQSVARMIGDRSGRSRMNADGSLKASYRPKGNMIVTAEEAYSNVGESAVARSISVDMKPEDINLDALTVVQNHAYHLNQCMSEYIQWVLKHWDMLVAELKPLFSDLRNKAQTGGHGRLAECVAHLQIGFICMCKWLQDIEQMDEKTAQNIQSEAWDEFIKLAEAQNKRIMGEKPVKLFLDALREMKTRKSIRIKESVNGAWENCSYPVHGYSDSTYYYLFPDAIYSEVRKYYAEQNFIFPLGKSALYKQMANDGILERDKDQITKVKSIGGKRIRLLWLRASTIDAEEKEVSNDE